MKPTKFYYQEDPVRAKCVLIEWTDRGLELQKSKAWVPHFFTESDICLHPSDEDWNRFVEEVKALDLHPSSTFESRDWIKVNCHIKFRTNLVKFSIKDQDFFGFDRFKLLVNDLTKCQEFPRGIFDREEEEKEMENFRLKSAIWDDWCDEVNPKEIERGFTVVEEVICTLKSVKGYETSLKEEIFKFVHGQLGKGSYSFRFEEMRELLVWEKKDEFLKKLVDYTCDNLIIHIEDELVSDKERIKKLINLPSCQSVSCVDSLSGRPDCLRMGDAFYFSDELKQEAVENEGLITCPFCGEYIDIFDGYNTTYDHFFHFYLKDIYLKKVNRWAEEYKKALT